jgi:hypothetical protein
MKKIILAILALLVIGGGVFFFLNSKENYDPSKYSASVKPAPMNLDSVIDFTLPDQFDKAHSLEEGTKTMIFTFAKKSAHVVRNFLKQKPADFLSTNEAVYIADIHPMPVVIRNAFAMPDLKKSEYPVILIYEEKISKLFANPKNKEDVMIVELENKKVKNISFAKDLKELEAKFK